MLSNNLKIASMILIFTQVGFANPNEAAIRKSVDDFYKWYVGLSSSKTGEPPFATAIKQRPNLFSSRLLTALQEDAKAQAAAVGEIDGLDFDPFLNSQDQSPSYAVGNIQSWQGLYWVEIYSCNSRGQRKQLATTILVSFETGKLEFQNFNYSKGRNLLEILKALHKK